MSLPFVARRIGDGPILWAGMPGLEGERGANVNGPSLIRVPDWVENRLGAYYLYFAHHRGRDIRLAYADRLEGPWTVSQRGVLEVDATAASSHIASPDVHVDHGRRRLRMYFHGDLPDGREQASFLAESGDGLRFAAQSTVVAPFYLRVFEHDGWFYGVAKLRNVSGVLLRSHDGSQPFEAGRRIVARMRHAAVLKRDAEAWLFYSRIGDAPESVLAAPLPLRGKWTRWRPQDGAVVLSPEQAWEGAGRPVEPSRPGPAMTPLCELRDPAIHVEDDRIILLYSVAGEQGIALAELRAR
jgi:hypothetical protein